MIIFFGPAGVGKSVQAQILAARQGWHWLSAGQLLRDTHDDGVLKAQQDGKLVSLEIIDRIMGEALNRANHVEDVILDGFPRKIEQAQWLIENCKSQGYSIELVIVLEVPRSEILKRLELRGRVDDTPESINERLLIYRKEVYPILNYFTEQGVNIVHIDGVGTVGQVYDKVMEELVACKLV